MGIYAEKKYIRDQLVEWTNKKFYLQMCLEMLSYPLFIRNYILSIIFKSKFFMFGD